jgi:hypothetical protein
MTIQSNDPPIQIRNTSDQGESARHEAESRQATVAALEVTAESLVILDAARILSDRRIIVHEEVEI